MYSSSGRVWSYSLLFFEKHACSIIITTMYVIMARPCMYSILDNKYKTNPNVKLPLKCSHLTFFTPNGG